MQWSMTRVVLQDLFHCEVYTNFYYLFKLQFQFLPDLSVLCLFLKVTPGDRHNLSPHLVILIPHPLQVLFQVLLPRFQLRTVLLYHTCGLKNGE